MTIKLAQANEQIEREEQFLSVDSPKIGNMIFKDLIVKRLLPKLEDILDREESNKTLVIAAASCLSQMLIIASEDEDMNDTRALLLSKLVDYSGLFKQ